jgi:hypothetical protein
MGFNRLIVLRGFISIIKVNILDIFRILKLLIILEKLILKSNKAKKINRYK